MGQKTARFRTDTGFLLGPRRTTDARKSRRGTEVPRPFGSVHEGASALANVHRTVGAYIDLLDRRGVDSAGRRHHCEVAPFPCLVFIERRFDAKRTTAGSPAKRGDSRKVARLPRASTGQQKPRALGRARGRGVGANNLCRSELRCSEPNPLPCPAPLLSSGRGTCSIVNQR